MRIESFRVVNYKSFADSGKVHFEPGFSVIVGQNNAGKTALAEALSLGFGGNPHRSTVTIPSPGASPDPVSCAEVTFQLDVDEIKQLLAGNLPTRSYSVPAGSDSREDEALARRFLDLVSGGPMVEARFESQVGTVAGDLRSASLRGYGLGTVKAGSYFLTWIRRQVCYGNYPKSPMVTLRPRTISRRGWPKSAKRGYTCSGPLSLT